MEIERPCPPFMAAIANKTFPKSRCRVMAGRSASSAAPDRGQEAAHPAFIALHRALSNQEQRGNAAGII
jgi:hypothetical protein